MATFSQSHPDPKSASWARTKFSHLPCCTSVGKADHPPLPQLSIFPNHWGSVEQHNESSTYCISQSTVKLGVITQVESSAVVFLINTVFLSISFSFSLSEHQSQFYRGHHSWGNKNPEWFLIGCFFWPAHQIKTIVFGRYQQLQDLTNPRSFHEKGLSFSGHKKPSTPDQSENLENISVCVQKRHFADYIIMAA